MLVSLILALALILAGGFFRFALVGYGTLAYACWALALLVALFALLKRKGLRRCRIALTVLVCLGLALLIALEIPILRDARTDAVPEADYLIVLGAGVNGSVPSLSLLNRLTAAREYLETYPQAVAIVSGGQGPGEDATEASVMAAWLEGAGIEPQRILQEDQATSTLENLGYSLELIRQRGDEGARIAIVSSEYHLYRARYMARSLGIESPKGVAARTSYPVLKANYFLREAFAVAFLRVFG